MTITGFSIFKAGVYAALGWFVGRAIYTSAVTFAMWACDKISRMC